MIKNWMVAGTAMLALAAVGALTAGSMGKAGAQDAPATPGAARNLDRAEVETIVREYLLANPEILIEMQDVLEKRQEEEQRVATLATIEEAKDEIFNSAHDGVVGNPNGTTTVVEFYDYNCGFCERAMQDMLALTAADRDLRFVLKEFPILGPDSQKAHVVSMAFRSLMPEKYGEFHQQLMTMDGRAGEATAVKIALSLGADEAALKAAMKDPAITEAFNRTYDLANRLKITGTPSYVVGDQVVYGALGAEVLSEKIAAARACGENAAC
ncbi:MAG TPA: DsbA family protein [Mesorhizobium sp.]|nr:DsbA family protein [Mesorhizobium sp.]